MPPQAVWSMLTLQWSFASTRIGPSGVIATSQQSVRSGRAASAAATVSARTSGQKGRG
jgi:hypothetical protein